MQPLLVTSIYILCTLGYMQNENEIDAAPATKFTYTPSWTIDNMAEIVNSRVGERFESAEFDIGNGTWQIISFPNGNDNNTAGSYMVFLALKQMPDHWKQVTVRFTISSTETFSRLTRIAVYDKPKGLGWWEKSLSLKELKDKRYNTLEWIINIHILRITSNSDKVLYQHPLSYKNKHHIEWKVDGALLDSMKDASQGKSFEMLQNFNQDIRYNNDMWTIRVIPNGKDDGFVDVYLELFALPINIYSMKVQYTLSCLETGTTSTYITYFDYINSYWSWQNKILLFDDFKNVHGSATFVADIEILNYFDKAGLEVVTMSHIVQLKARLKELEGIKKENDELKSSVEGMEQKMSWLVGRFETMGFMLNVNRSGISNLNGVCV